MAPRGVGTQNEQPDQTGSGCHRVTGCRGHATRNDQHDTGSRPGRLNRNDHRVGQPGGICELPRQPLGYWMTVGR